VITYERSGKVIERILTVKPDGKGGPKLSTMSFDIETYNPAGKPREGKDPIIMVSYCCDEHGKNTKKGVITFKKSKHRYVETVKSEAAMLDKIIAQAKFGDIPEVLVKHEAEVMMSELEYSVKKQGAKFDDYLLHLKKTREQLALEIMPEAVKRVKASLIIREVGKLEKISVSHDEIHQAIDDILKQYKGKKEVEDRVKSQAYHDYVENNLIGKKVMEKLLEWNMQKPL